MTHKWEQTQTDACELMLTALKKEDGSEKLTCVGTIRRMRFDDNPNQPYWLATVNNPQSSVVFTKKRMAKFWVVKTHMLRLVGEEG